LQQGASLGVLLRGGEGYALAFRPGGKIQKICCGLIGKISNDISVKARLDFNRTRQKYNLRL
jgi:hypothetical protein